MLTLFSYPELFGVADNNPFGLKIYAFMRLAALSFEHRHIFDAREAPHGQLPYLLDEGITIGDSEAIIAHLKAHHAVTLDDALTMEQATLGLMVRRVLDDLYWPMSYSRWQDDRYWPAFRDALLAAHPEVAPSDLTAVREYNRLRYHYQGIGRYPPEAAYARGIKDLGAMANLLGDRQFLFGDAPSSADAAIYGFVANILFYAIDTPLKRYTITQPGLVEHCMRVHRALK